MKLRAWMERGKVTYSALGRACGFGDRAAWRYAHDKRIPRRAHAISIYLFTKGAVAPNDFYDLPPLQLELQQSEAA